MGGVSCHRGETAGVVGLDPVTHQQQVCASPSQDGFNALPEGGGHHGIGDQVAQLFRRSEGVGQGHKHSLLPSPKAGEQVDSQHSQHAGVGLVGSRLTGLMP